jgi:predicted nucleic acid-binding protein
MIVFADTSALFALLVEDDLMHVRAVLNFQHLAAVDARLVTSSYVLLETLTLLQRRVSLEAVWDFTRKVRPLLEVVWAGEDWHTRAVQRLHVENQRGVSLTDCLSFEIMEVMEIRTAFTFDRHFAERGFEMAVFHDLDRG